MRRHSWTFRLQGVLIAGAAACLNTPASFAQNPTPPFPAELVEKGRYTAVAADCTACHTKPRGGKPFAGGYGIGSPLGAIYASNITPSRVAGIGNYTLAQFTAALRDGVAADGTHIYPAMPYTAYTKLSDDDILALYAYFMQGVAPVDEKAPDTVLPFPFNLRFSMAFWNALFLDKSRFTPDAAKSAEWNRGAYLVNALEHCSACHSPRNFLMAERQDAAFAGGPLGSWYAPNITADPISGLGAWTEEEIVQYLKAGAVAGKAQAAGGMAEAVTHSLQHLTDSDLKAIAVYVKSMDPIRDPGVTQAAFSYGRKADLEPAVRGIAITAQSRKTGAQLFSGNCASCHQPSGTGTRAQYYPELFHNSATGRDRADNLISVILFGVDRDVNGQHTYMPHFGPQSYVQALTDAQIADVSNYVLQTFGNPAVHVSEADVATARTGGPPSALVKATAWGLPLGGLTSVILALGVAWYFIRRRRSL